MTYKNYYTLLGKGFLLYLPLSLLYPLYMYYERDQSKLILLDSQSSYHVTEYANEEKLKQLYCYQIEQATLAFLMRNPNGFDQPSLVKEIFIKDALKSVYQELDKEAELFKSFKMHQKVEIQNIRILRANRKKSYAKVTGQLFRFYTSINNTNKQALVLNFELNIEMEVNYNLATESKYPFNITKLTYTSSEQNDNERQNKQ